MQGKLIFPHQKVRELLDQLLLALDHLVPFYCSAAILADCGEEFAIRKMSDAFRDAGMARRTLREIKLLQHLKHDNVSRLRCIKAGTGDQTRSIRNHPRKL
jgi:serine/threonine protein kinase